jgi:ribosomal protein L11 methyltransferase
VLGLVVTAPAHEVELASDALWTLGVVAIEERNDGDQIELWTSLGDDRASVIGAASKVLAKWAWRLVEVDESVADTWRLHAQPTWVASDLVVCPAWIPFPDSPGVTVIRIEPGATFGLGDHPTTVLSMRTMRELLRSGSTVLDVGCGSGVLAVSACVLGAASARAVDISPASVPTTRTNADANGVGARVDVSTTPLVEVDGQFDIVVANILAPTLIDLADDLIRLTAPGGALVVSGVLADRHDHVEAALRPLRRADRATLDGWAALTFVAPRNVSA